MEFDEIKYMLDSMDSQTAFDNLRLTIRNRGTCKGNFGQGNVNDSEYGTPSRIENFTSHYLLDKSEENTQVLADNDKINIYGEERIATNQWSTYNYYITGLNESVYTVTETTSWSDKQTDIEYTDTGLTDDIDKGYAYNGEAKDVSGLIYLRARYYNPKIGQFVQIDSYTGEDENIASQNRYCYTINNPYKYIDPSGHFSLSSALKGVGNIIKETANNVKKTATRIVKNVATNAKKTNNKKHHSGGKTNGTGGTLKSSSKNSSYNGEGKTSGSKGGGVRGTKTTNKFVKLITVTKNISNKVIKNIKRTVKTPDVCKKQKSKDIKHISTTYTHKIDLGSIIHDYGVFTLKFKRVLEAKYELTSKDKTVLSRMGENIDNDLKINTSIDFGDITTILKNLGFKFSVGSWGQLNFIFYTSYRTTTTTLKFFFQTINIFANDGVSYSSMTQIDKYVRMGIEFEISLNKFLAAALIVGATMAVPTIAPSLSLQGVQMARWLAKYGSAAATYAALNYKGA